MTGAKCDGFERQTHDRTRSLKETAAVVRSWVNRKIYEVDLPPAPSVGLGTREEARCLVSSFTDSITR